MNLKIVLKLFFNYKITQTLKTKPQPQISWIQIPQTLLAIHTSQALGFFQLSPSFLPAHFAKCCPGHL